MTATRSLSVRQDRWVWLSVLPLGLGAWAPIYAGARVRNSRWCGLGALWSLITVAGWILSTASDGKAGVGGGLIILGWVGAIATSFSIRSAYASQLDSPFTAALQGAEGRLVDRERARKLVRERPALARELGVGRPDLPHAHDAGLVDVNSAPAAVLAELPGVDDALAQRIVQARAETHGFSSVEDLGVVLDLDGGIVEGIRDQAVFLPG